MKKTIFCTKDPEHFNLINFYIEVDNQVYFLFTQHYSNTAFNRFKAPVFLDTALKYQKGLQMRSFNEKLPKFIKYIEDTEGIVIMKRTMRKKNKYSIPA